MRHISYSRGKGKLRHNNRDIISPNVDQSRIANNITLKQQSLADAYEEIFGKATAEYNKKQRRSDRKIKNYFEKLFGENPDSMQADTILRDKDKRQSFYEYVVSFGTMHDTGYATNPEMAATSVKCLKEYMAGFTKRNPQFHVFNAVIHQDEATPHLHYDMIPFADGYKTSLTRQQSISKALEQMGYDTGADAIANFTQSERKVFREICERHGVEIAEETKGRGHTYTCEEYRQTAEKNKREIEESEQKKVAVKEELADLTQQKNNLQSDVEQSKSDVEQAKKTQSEIQQGIEKLTEKKTQLQSEVEQAALKKVSEFLTGKGSKKVAAAEAIVANADEVKKAMTIEKSHELAQVKKLTDQLQLKEKQLDKTEQEQEQTAKRQTYTARQQYQKEQALSQREEALHQAQQQLAQQQEKMKWTAKSQARYEAEKLLSGGGYVRKVNPDQQRLMQAQTHSQTVRENPQQAYNNDFEIER